LQPRGDSLDTRFLQKNRPVRSKFLVEGGILGQYL